MDYAFHLHFLGTIQIQQAGQRLHGLRSRKALALLGYLALEHRPVPRSALVELFWGDLPEARGRVNLTSVLIKLARVLPGCLQIDRDSVAFQTGEDYWLDLTAFDRLLAEGGPTAWHAALDLYQGELMADLILDHCPDFEMWLLAERERWRQRVLYLLQTLSAQYIGQHEYGRALNLTDRWLTLDPFQEDAHRQMLWLLWRNGWRSAALAHYAAYCRLLAEELKVGPSAEIQRLYQRIERVHLRTVNTLPAPLTPLIGREAELAEVNRQLADPAGRLVTLTGPGGIGKSRLALQVAIAQRAAYLDGVFWVPLDTVNSIPGVVAAVSQAIDLSFGGRVESRGQLLSYLRDKEMLLVLDSLDYSQAQSAGSEEAAGLIVELLRNAPAVKILVTSQQRLNVAGEWTLHLAGLPVPPLDRLAESESYGAVQLFLQSAQRVDPFFQLTDDLRPLVVYICRRVEGLPLALELMAAWGRALEYAEVVRALSRNWDMSGLAQAGCPARHQSLRAVCEYAWQWLSPAERQAFRRLAVFRDGFEHAAAEQVAGVSLPRLVSLADKSLVCKTPTGRYHIHEVLRQYGLERLTEQPTEKAEIEQRHRCYYLELAEQARQAVLAARPWPWLNRLEAELDNLWMTFQNLIERGEAEQALQLCIALGKFWWDRHYLNEGYEWLEQALAAGRGQPIEPSVLSTAFELAGLFAQLRGELQQARLWLEAALALLRSLGDKHAMAVTLSGLASIALGQHAYRQALAFNEEGLALYRELGDERGAKLMRINLSVAWRNLNDDPAARVDDEAARALVQTTDRLPGTFGRLVLTPAGAPRASEAAAAALILKASLGLAHDLGLPGELTQELIQLAYNAMRQDELVIALRLYDVAQSQREPLEVGQVWSCYGLEKVSGLRAREAASLPGPTKTPPMTFKSIAADTVARLA